MQSACKGAVAKPPHTLSRYHFCYLDGNNIGDEGCSHLSKAQWPKLYTFYLGIFCANKVKTILEMKDVVIFRRHSGTIFTLFSYVSVIVFREKSYWR